MCQSVGCDGRTTAAAAVVLALALLLAAQAVEQPVNGSALVLKDAY